jgi:peptidoglycan/LPS O-acetylase OafA/YrhL
MSTDAAARIDRASAPTTPRVFPALDTVRAVGALMVLTTHVAFWTGNYGFDLWGTFLARLDAGVALFFVLSGFLLSRPFLLSARAGAPAPDTRRYLWKRALRVMPAYWIVAVIAMVLVEDNAGAGVWDWVRALTLTDIYLSDQVPHGITQTWSLATEVAFYVTLPVVMVLWNRSTKGRRSDRAAVVLLLAAVMVSAGWTLGVPQALAERTPLHHQWLPAFLVWFVVGITLAHVHVHHVEHDDEGEGRVFGWLLDLGRQPGVCLVMAAAILVAASTPLAGPPVLAPPTSAQLVTKTMLYAAFGGLVVLASLLVSPGGTFARVMTHPVARHLGRISYGVFCVHVLVLHLVTHSTGWKPFEGHGLPIFVLTVVLSIAIAEMIYRLVERPLSRLGNRESAVAAASSPRGSTISS